MQTQLIIVFVSFKQNVFAAGACKSCWDVSADDDGDVDADSSFYCELIK